MIAPATICPTCEGKIHPIAGRCKHCKTDLSDLRRQETVQIQRAQSQLVPDTGAQPPAGSTPTAPEAGLQPPPNTSPALPGTGGHQPNPWQRPSSQPTSDNYADNTAVPAQPATPPTSGSPSHQAPATPYLAPPGLLPNIVPSQRGTVHNPTAAGANTPRIDTSPVQLSPAPVLSQPPAPNTDSSAPKRSLAANWPIVAAVVAIVAIVITLGVIVASDGGSGAISPREPQNPATRRLSANDFFGKSAPANGKNYVRLVFAQICAKLQQCGKNSDFADLVCKKTTTELPTCTKYDRKAAQQCLDTIERAKCGSGERLMLELSRAEVCKASCGDW